MLRSTRTLILLAVVVSLMAATMPAIASWSLYNDWSSTANPNGAWSYGYTPQAAYSFNPFTAASVPNSGWGGTWAQSSAWNGAGKSCDGCPTAFVYKYVGNAVWDLFGQSVNLIPGIQCLQRRYRIESRCKVDRSSRRLLLLQHFHAAV